MFEGARIRIKDIVFQVTDKCDQVCPHCFMDSSPGKKRFLQLDQIEYALSDLVSALINPDTFILTGGEPTLHPKFKLIIKKIRQKFPKAKVRIDTNGLNFYNDIKLFQTLNADIYDISIDNFHNQGLIVFPESKIFLRDNGESPILDHFLNEKKQFKFILNVRWTSNRNDQKEFENFLQFYKDNQLNIVKKEVTATGRARSLPKSILGEGYVVSKKKNNFQCLLGQSLLLAVTGEWYGCYHPVAFTKLGKPGESDFSSKLVKLLSSKLCKDLSSGGIDLVMRQLKLCKPRSVKKLNEILKNRYWYRCQPCQSLELTKIIKSWEDYGG